MSTPNTVSDKPSNNVIWIILLLGCALLLALSLWFGQQILQQPDDNLFAPDPGCLLPQHSCSANDGTHSIRFSIDANAVSSNTPFSVRVDISGYDNPQITVRLHSISMFMGETLTALQQQADGSYQAEVQLPVCSFDTRQWRAKLLVSDHTGISGSWFDFESN